MRKLLLLTLLLVAARTNAQVITLDSVIHAIDRSYPMIKMYDVMADARSEYARSASSWMLPKITAGLWQTPYNAIGDGMFMVGVEQMIPNPAKVNAKERMMRSEAALDRASQSVALRDMHTMAKRAYYGRSVLERKLRAIDETDSLLAFVIALATDRYPTGKESLENIYKAQAARAELSSMRTMTTADIGMNNAELRNFLGAAAGAFQIDSTLPVSAVSADRMVADSIPEVRSIDAEITMMRSRRDVERSALYPEFGVSVNHMQALNSMMPNQFSVMGMVSLPIAPWSRTEADAMSAGVDREIESMQLKRDATIRERAAKSEMLRAQVDGSRTQLENITSVVLPAYKRSFDASLRAYEQNAGDLFRVIDAWQMLRMTEMNRLDLLKSLINAQISYEDAVSND